MMKKMDTQMKMQKMIEKYVALDLICTRIKFFWC